MARRPLGPLGLEEDAAQTTLLRVLLYFRSGKSMDDPKKLPGLVTRFARNVTLEMHRKGGPLPPEPEGFELPDARPSPLTELKQRERLRILNKGISALPKRYRQLIVELANEEDRGKLRKRYGTTPGALRLRIRKARLRLKEELDKLGFDWD